MKTRVPPSKRLDPSKLGRLAGFGLPTTLDSEAFARIAAGRQREPAVKSASYLESDVHTSDLDIFEAEPSIFETVHIASLREIPIDYKPIGGGFYRQGHTVWELRGAEDEEGGYVLTRKQEERAVDLRNRTAEAKPRLSRTASGVVVHLGAQATILKQGQLSPVIVVSLGGELGGDMAGVQSDEGEELAVPLEALMSLEELSACPCGCMLGCPCSCHGVHGDGDGGHDDDMFGDEMDAELAPGLEVGAGDGEDAHNTNTALALDMHAPSQGMAPQVEPSSLAARDDGADESTQRTPTIHIVRQSLADHAKVAQLDQWDVGKWVEPSRAFSPRYMGGQYTFDPDDRTAYEIIGANSADTHGDFAMGLPNPVLPGKSTENNRVELKPYGGGDSIFISPMELQRYFAPTQQMTSPTRSMSSPEETSEMETPPGMRDWSGETPDMREPDEDPTDVSNPVLNEHEPTIGDVPQWFEQLVRRQPEQRQDATSIRQQWNEWQRQQHGPDPTALSRTRIAPGRGRL